jgi:gas vesicle protein
MQRGYYNDQGNTPMNAMGMALLGGVIGAATALFFSDERRRKALREVFSDLQDRAERVGGQVRDTATQVRDRAERVSDDVRTRARDMIGEVEDRAEDAGNKVRKQMNGLGRGDNKR